MEGEQILDGWTATVNGSVSKVESSGTVRPYMSKLAETLPPVASKNEAG